MAKSKTHKPQRQNTSKKRQERRETIQKTYVLEPQSARIIGTPGTQTSTSKEGILKDIATVISFLGQAQQNLIDEFATKVYAKSAGQFSNAKARKMLGNEIPTPAGWLQPYRLKEMARTEAWRLLSAYQKRDEVACLLDEHGWDTEYKDLKLKKGQRKPKENLYNNIKRSGRHPEVPKVSNPRMKLSAVNSQFVNLSVNADNRVIYLDMVVKDSWVELEFRIPDRMFAEWVSIRKVCKPTIQLVDGAVRFFFSADVVADPSVPVVESPHGRSCLCFDVGDSDHNPLAIMRVYEDGTLGSRYFVSCFTQDLWLRLRRLSVEKALCVAKLSRCRELGVEDNPNLVRQIGELAGKVSRLKWQFARCAAVDLVGCARVGEPVVTENLSWLVGSGLWCFGEIVSAVQWVCSRDGHDFVFVSARDASHTCPHCFCRVEPDSVSRVSSCVCGWSDDRDFTACAVMGLRYFDAVHVFLGGSRPRVRRASGVSRREHVRAVCYGVSSGEVRKASDFCGVGGDNAGRSPLSDSSSSAPVEPDCYYLEQKSDLSIGLSFPMAKNLISLNRIT